MSWLLAWSLAALLRFRGQLAPQQRCRRVSKWAERIAVQSFRCAAAAGTTVSEVAASVIMRFAVTGFTPAEVGGEGFTAIAGAATGVDGVTVDGAAAGATVTAVGISCTARCRSSAGVPTMATTVADAAGCATGIM